jgi:hypothetical protein
VLRGGSWNNKPRRLRSANRNRNNPQNRNNNVGFRLAQSARTTQSRPVHGPTERDVRVSMSPPPGLAGMGAPNSIARTAGDGAGRPWPKAPFPFFEYRLMHMALTVQERIACRVRCARRSPARITHPTVQGRRIAMWIQDHETKEKYFGVGRQSFADKRPERIPGLRKHYLESYSSGP